VGTNYYWHEKPAPCSTCGHDRSKVLHIGKSSMGWVFMLHVDPEEGLNTLEDWRCRWLENGSKILSEYGTLTPLDKMEDIILDRENTSKPWSVDDMRQNCAIQGPNGLYRGTLNFAPTDDATYDLVDGEFS